MPEQVISCRETLPPIPNPARPTMPVDDPNDLEKVDQEIRINELKAEAEELVGKEMSGGEADDCPPEIQEQFWKNVVEYEKAR
jgi:hypothetical protein